jgi:hypothetical protein
MKIRILYERKGVIYNLNYGLAKTCNANFLLLTL